MLTALAGPGSVLVLKREVGAANGPGQLRPLPRELEPGGELRGDFHPFGQLEPDRPLPGVVDGVHHVDRQAALVEDIGHPDVLDLEGRGLERAKRYDDVAFFPEDPVHPVYGRLGVARRFHREDVAVLVLEVAGLVRPQASEGRRDRRRLQASGRDGAEIHGVGHDALPNDAKVCPFTSARIYLSRERPAADLVLAPWTGHGDGLARATVVLIENSRGIKPSPVENTESAEPDENGLGFGERVEGLVAELAPPSRWS